MSKPSASVLSKQGDKYIGTPYAKMDCQALVEQMLRDVGINLNLTGSNAWYRKMTWTGSPEECKRTFGRIPVGAFLYILRQDGGEPGKYKADGIGNACHIGIYIARQDGAINSSSKRGKVCYSKFAGKSISGGWNRIGLWDRLSYGEDIDKKIGGPVPVRAIVTSDNGLSVNLRQKASTKASIIARLPVGTVVDVTGSYAGSDGEWSSVAAAGYGSGYIMTRYLQMEGAAADPDQSAGGTITVQLTRAQADALVALVDAVADQIGRG